ncbi:MAG: iron-sulfur cluster assembly scaffold protein [Candidatus Helarchaeota archaeon]
MSNIKKTEFDKFIEQLQEEINEQERQDYSEKVIAEYHNPYHFQKMENPTVHGKYRGWCGDSLQFFLKIDNERRIKIATFITDGCGATTACGSMMAKMIENMTVDEALKITEDDLKKALDGLPPENDHCATLAVNTLKETLKNYNR